MTVKLTNLLRCLGSENGCACRRSLERRERRERERGSERERERWRAGERERERGREGERERGRARAGGRTWMANFLISGLHVTCGRSTSARQPRHDAERGEGSAGRGSASWPIGCAGGRGAVLPSSQGKSNGTPSSIPECARGEDDVKRRRLGNRRCHHAGVRGWRASMMLLRWTESITLRWMGTIMLQSTAPIILRIDAGPRGCAAEGAGAR